MFPLIVPLPDLRDPVQPPETVRGQPVRPGPRQLQLHPLQVLLPRQERSPPTRPVPSARPGGAAPPAAAASGGTDGPGGHRRHFPGRRLNGRGTGGEL